MPCRAPSPPHVLHAALHAQRGGNGGQYRRQRLNDEFPRFLAHNANFFEFFGQRSPSGVEGQRSKVKGDFVWKTIQPRRGDL